VPELGGRVQDQEPQVMPGQVPGRGQAVARPAWPPPITTTSTRSPLVLLAPTACDCFSSRVLAVSGYMLDDHASRTLFAPAKWPVLPGQPKLAPAAIATVRITAATQSAVTQNGGHQRVLAT
jgi:hypothetical protein